MKEVKLNYKNSVKLLNRALAVDSKLQNMVEKQIAQSHDDLRKQINQKILDLANEKGCSLWDICFNYFPDFEFDIEGTPDKPTMVTRMTLRPLKFEFDKEDDETRKI